MSKFFRFYSPPHPCNIVPAPSHCISVIWFHMSHGASPITLYICHMASHVTWCQPHHTVHLSYTFTCHIVPVPSHCISVIWFHMLHCASPITLNICHMVSHVTLCQPHHTVYLSYGFTCHIVPALSHCISVIWFHISHCASPIRLNICHMVSHVTLCQPHHAVYLSYGFTCQIVPAPSHYISVIWFHMSHCASPITLYIGHMVSHVTLCQPHHTIYLSCGFTCHIVPAPSHCISVIWFDMSHGPASSHCIYVIWFHMSHGASPITLYICHMVSHVTLCQPHHTVYLSYGFTCHMVPAPSHCISVIWFHMSHCASPITLYICHMVSHVTLCQPHHTVYLSYGFTCHMVPAPSRCISVIWFHMSHGASPITLYICHTVSHVTLRQPHHAVYLSYGFTCHMVPAPSHCIYVIWFHMSHGPASSHCIYVIWFHMSHVASPITLYVCHMVSHVTLCQPHHTVYLSYGFTCHIVPAPSHYISVMWFHMSHCAIPSHCISVIWFDMSHGVNPITLYICHMVSHGTLCQPHHTIYLSCGFTCHIVPAPSHCISVIWVHMSHGASPITLYICHMVSHVTLCQPHQTVYLSYGFTCHIVPAPSHCIYAIWFHMSHCASPITLYIFHMVSHVTLCQSHHTVYLSYGSTCKLDILSIHKLNCTPSQD